MPRMQKLIISLLAVAAWATAWADQASTNREANDKRSELEKQHNRTLISMGGGVEQAIKDQYKSFLVVSYCYGSFKNEGYYEYAVGMVDPSAKQGRYIVFLNGPNDRYRATELARFTVEFDHKGRLATAVEVDCPSAMQLKRQNETIKVSESIYGKLTPISYFDAICLAPHDSHNAFSCYGYNFKKKKFVSVGGWTN